MNRRTFFSLFALAALLAAGCVSACAAERVLLQNGYEMLCDHHAAVGNRIRVYTTASEESYQEFSAAEIARFEAAPAELQPPTKPEKPTTPTLTRADIGVILSHASHEHNVDVDLLASVVKAESGGNSRAVSRTGARGLMQLMPGTAATLGVQDSFRPDENVRGGSTYLDSLLARYHDNLALALAAYNAGPAAVDKYHGIPPYRETRAYVARVIHEFNRRVKARLAQEQALAMHAKQHSTETASR